MPDAVHAPAGWTMSSEVFEHQLAGLSSTFRVVTFDPRGHGRSTATAGGKLPAARARPPLASGAGDEWAEADLDGFLEIFVGPVVADPAAFLTG